MISSILIIRLKQLIRIVNELGLGRFIFIAIIVALIDVFVFMSVKDRDGAFITSSVWLVLIFTLHLKRKDLFFLRTHIENYRFLITIEYIFISIPLIAGLIYWHKYTVFVLFLVLLSAIGLTTKGLKKRTLNSLIQRLIPDECFEWKSGIRSSLVFLIPLIVIGIAGSGWPGTVPVIMIIIGLMVLGFLEKNEPLPLVLIFEKSTNKFLLLKIKNQLKLYSMLVLPLMLLFIIWHSEYWYIVTALYLLCVSVQIYAVLSKYSFYQPHVTSGNQVFIVLGFVSIFIPFLLPLILVLGIRFYFRSVSNLNQYLHDYN